MSSVSPLPYCCVCGYEAGEATFPIWPKSGRDFGTVCVACDQVEHERMLLEAKQIQGES